MVERVANSLLPHRPLRRFFNVLLGTSIIFVSVVSNAATSIVQKAEIVWLRASDSTSSICVVKLNVDVETEGTETIDCAGSAVAIKCGGTIDGEPSRTFDLALFAFENRRKISVRIDDEKKFDDVCYATRIWVTRELAACTDDDDDEEDDCDAYNYYDDDDDDSDSSSSSYGSCDDDCDDDEDDCDEDDCDERDDN